MSAQLPLWERPVTYASVGATQSADLMAKYPAGETENVIRDTAGVSGTVAKLGMASLLQDGSAVPCDVTKANRAKPYQGYKLNTDDTTHE